MRKAFLIVVSLFWALGAGAQGVARISSELARVGTLPDGHIEIRMEPAAAEAIREADQNPSLANVMAYRVRLFSDNSQNARENAYAAARQFAEMYPDVAVEVSYEVPYFWVTAGCFASNLEAVALRGKVLAHFPKAVVARQEMPLGAVIAEKKAEAPAE
jgi:hypothetical protein